MAQIAPWPLGVVARHGCCPSLPKAGVVPASTLPKAPLSFPPPPPSPLCRLQLLSPWSSIEGPTTLVTAICCRLWRQQTGVDRADPLILSMLREWCNGVGTPHDDNEARNCTGAMPRSQDRTAATKLHSIFTARCRAAYKERKVCL